MSHSKRPDRRCEISLAIMLICLIGLFIELASIKSSSPAYLGKYSTGIFALLIATVIASTIVGAILIWCVSSAPDRRVHVANWLKRLLNTQPYRAFVLLILLVSLFILWNFYPYSRTSLRLITAVILIVFIQFLYLSQPQTSPYWKTFFSNPTAMTWGLGIFLSLHLIAGTLLASTISDEGAQVYTQVQLAYGNYTPYAPGGLQMWYAPLSYYIQGAFLRIFGPHLLVARLVSAVAGIASIPLMVSITNHEAKNKFGGVIALAIFTLSFSNLLNYSTAFGYSLTAFFLLLALRSAQVMKSGWQRVALGLVFAGLATLVRHTMITAPLVFAIYFLFTEKFHHFLIGSVIAAAVGLAILWPFWPEIITMAWPINGALDLVYPGVGSQVEKASIQGGPFTNLGTTLNNFHILISSYLVGFMAMLWAAVLLIKRMSKWEEPGKSLRKNHILILAAALVLSSFVLHFYSMTVQCMGCMPFYFSYFWPIVIIILAIILVRLSPPDHLSPHFMSIGLTAMLALFIIFSGRRAIAVQRYVWPPAPLEVQKTSAQISAYLDEDDVVFAFGPLQPLIPLVNNPIFPEADYYYNNYLPSPHDVDRWAMAVLHKYDNSTVDEWLSQKADVVVITDTGLNIMSAHPSLIETINSGLDENFVLVEELTVSDSFPTGDIQIYQRKED